MWNMYDELYIAIPSGILVEGCVVGKLWTTVRANGNIGIARTLGDVERDLNALSQSMIGQPVREVANWMKWGDDLVLASIGVAALNAFYNRTDRMEKLNAPPVFQNDLCGKKVAVIGELPNLVAGLNDCTDLTVLPLPESKVLDDAYIDAMGNDFVFISGDALTNQTLPTLLKKVGGNTKVTLAGTSVPAAPVLYAFGNPIHNLSGVYARFDTTVEAAAKLDLTDLAPGTLPFSINPVKPQRLHEKEEVIRYKNSPYGASAFNCAFNPWEGADYDQSTWSPLYKK